MADVLLSEGRRSSRSHRCEWKNGLDDSVCIMILLCRLISDDMIAVETVCLWTIAVCHYGGCVPLVVTMCHWLVSMCYLVWLCTTMDRHSCVLLNGIVLISMNTIGSVENDYQLDGNMFGLEE